MSYEIVHKSHRGWQAEFNDWNRWCSGSAEAHFVVFYQYCLEQNEERINWNGLECKCHKSVLYMGRVRNEYSADDATPMAVWTDFIHGTSLCLLLIIGTYFSLFLATFLGRLGGGGGLPILIWQTHESAPLTMITIPWHHLCCTLFMIGACFFLWCAVFILIGFIMKWKINTRQY